MWRHWLGLAILLLNSEFGISQKSDAATAPGKKLGNVELNQHTLDPSPDRRGKG